jgi:hypothetical protein
MEAGNSPQMIFKHYRELVRPNEAKAWFGLMPASKNCIRRCLDKTQNENPQEIIFGWTGVVRVA